MTNELKDMSFSELQEKFADISQPAKLVTVELTNFLAMNLPPRELILAPWLPKAGLCMIHAYRGIGKTHLSLRSISKQISVKNRR